MQHVKMILDWIAGLSPESPEDGVLVKSRQRYHAFALVMIVSAALSGVGAAYLVFFVFRSVGVSIAAGAFWAVSIFLCERFLVLSMDETLTLRNVIFGLFRVAFAFLIASNAVIALELRFYDSEVVNRISQRASEDVNAATQQLGAFYAPARTALEERRSALRGKVSAKRGECEDAYQRWHREMRGISGEGTSGKEGVGPWAHLAAQEYDRCEKSYTALVEETAPALAEVEGQLGKIQQEFDRRLGARVADINAATGLLARIEAFEDIVHEHPTLWWKTTLLWLLLCVFESMPVLGKLLFPQRLSHEEAEALDDLIKSRKIAREIDLTAKLSHGRSRLETLLLMEKLAREGVARHLDSAAAHSREGDELQKAFYELMRARMSGLSSDVTVQTYSETPN